MENDILRRIAHIHLALSDIQDKGSHNNLAIELANCYVQAINYPKTRIKPRIPNEAVEIVSAKRFPDFMGKKFDNSYQSKKTLGEIYCFCKEREFEFESNINLILGKI